MGAVSSRCLASPYLTDPFHRLAQYILRKWEYIAFSWHLSPPVGEGTPLSIHAHKRGCGHIDSQMVKGRQGDRGVRRDMARLQMAITFPSPLFPLSPLSWTSRTARAAPTAYPLSFNNRMAVRQLPAMH